MNILAIDTCLGALSVAIGRELQDGRYCVAERYEERATAHAERLAPMVEAEMARAGLSFRDLDRVAVTLGPGTFTGVRTGIAFARGLRLAAGVEVVGTSSLAVIAHRAFELAEPMAPPAPLLVAVDARRGKLYVQLFGAGNALQPLSGPEEVTPDGAADVARRHGALLAGSGARAVVDVAGEAALQVVIDDIEPHAGDLVHLARRLTPLDDVTPLYIRPPDAKPQADKRLARTS
ncbi:MAG: tRNA (adenosine(37)-N6)-threonylcarbamoyltransferase complex dimerization subunit type 1 TsaB [Hyphomicrobiaceae bacterium]